MNSNLADSIAISVTTTAPAWVVMLQDVNLVLATISLLLGIAFAGWRWVRAIRHHEENEP